MGNPNAFALSLFFLVLSPNLGALAGAGDDSTNHDQLKTYIVHVKLPKDLHLIKHPDPMKIWYNSLLDNIPGVTSSTTKSSSEPRIVHSYSHAMTGFAAKFTGQEIEEVKKQDWCIHVQPDRIYRHQTTHTPQFLGLPLAGGLWEHANKGEGVIVCVIDSGIALNHPSYNDEGMPPPPAKWKGKCEPPVVCNNKLIGARSFIKGLTPEDELEGHGTHTSSTAAGALVQNTTVFGNAMGPMSGMAPRAHVAAYKVTSDNGEGSGSDIVAGMGQAMRDGCDILSVSLGADSWRDLYEEPVAAGSFSAVMAGVLVSASAGNEGPGPSTLSNEMPWVLTVGAGTMDRIMEAKVKLGNGEEYSGESLNQVKDFGNTMRPLVNGADYRDRNENATYCGTNGFDGIDIKGKIVLCQRGVVGRVEKGNIIKAAGGAGMILANDVANAYHVEADGHVIPASQVSYEAATKIRAYINSTSNPTATIQFNGQVTGGQAPVVSDFSSRGPNRACPGILKPDVIGPGVSIIAASPDQVEPADVFGNKSAPYYRMASGTSMSCPHLSGIAALVKAVHPDWSPAAIKSAIMTTAFITDNTGGPILNQEHVPADILTIGAGHVNVSRAHDPGLVYDTDPNDYDNFLCGLGYSNDQVESIVVRTVDCKTVSSITDHDLNYPSIALALGPVGSNHTVKRTVTNVGDANSFYWAEVEAPAGVNVIVTPSKLKFDQLKQTQTFAVNFARTGGNAGYVQGQLKWVSNKYVVRSPVSIKLQ